MWKKVPSILVSCALLCLLASCDKRARSRTRGSSGQDPRGLHWAAAMGDLPLVKRLVGEGADVNEVDSHGRATPLGIAADRGCEEIVDFLINHGADVNKECPLYYAAQQNNVGIARKLLEKGANPNKYRIGRVPSSLLAAVRNGNLEMVRLLVERGTDTSSAKGEDSPLFLAACGGHSDVVGFLLTKGLDANVSDGAGRTSLYVAATNGDTKTVRVLLDNKAKGNIRADNGETPLQAAERKGHQAVVSLLRQRETGE